jgi:hypothetical protein
MQQSSAEPDTLFVHAFLLTSSPNGTSIGALEERYDVCKPTILHSLTNILHGGDVSSQKSMQYILFES